jgi:hypothetical protein
MADLREGDALGTTLKQGDAKLLFQSPHMLGHGTLGYIQLFGSKPEVEVATSGVKCPERIERWNDRHLTIVNLLSLLFNSPFFMDFWMISC